MLQQGRRDIGLGRSVADDGDVLGESVSDDLVVVLDERHGEGRGGGRVGVGSTCAVQGSKAVRGFRAEERARGSEQAWAMKRGKKTKTKRTERETLKYRPGTCRYLFSLPVVDVKRDACVDASINPSRSFW